MNCIIRNEGGQRWFFDNIGDARIMAKKLSKRLMQRYDIRTTLTVSKYNGTVLGVYENGKRVE